MKTLIPRLTIVGAGPGDPELITLKAIYRINTKLLRKLKLMDY